MAFAGTLAELNGAAAASAKVWVSGQTVNQYQVSRDPVNMELYIRKTATGSGTTRPGLDPTNYRPISFTPVTGYSNAWSTGATTNSAVNTSFQGQTLTTNTPSLAAGVRTPVLELTGRGAAKFLALVSNTGWTSGTMRFEVEVDGRNVFNALLTTGSGGGFYLVAVGGAIPVPSSPHVAVFDKLEFVESLKVYVTASASGSAQAHFRHAYESYQS